MIRDEIKARSIAALRARDKATRSLLSGVLGRFGEEEKSAGFSGWTEDAERKLVASYVKSLKGSIEMMAGSDLAASYQAEVDLLALACSHEDQRRRIDGRDLCVADLHA